MCDNVAACFDYYVNVTPEIRVRYCDIFKISTKRANSNKISSMVFSTCVYIMFALPCYYTIFLYVHIYVVF